MSPRRACALLLAGALPLAVAACGGSAGVSGPRSPSPMAVLPDLSGLAWIEGDAFLAVHDAKVPEEAVAPRVSVVEARPGEALRWTPLAVDWPAASGPSHDLESVARVPGTATYLLAESGDGASAHRHLFVAELEGRSLTIREAAPWPVPVFDVEGTAVARVEERLYFLFAERAHGAGATQLAWAELTLDPLRLGPVRSVPFESPWPTGPDARPVSALEVDGEGRVWVASASDPDRDQGPFRSAVWAVGRFGAGAGGEGRLVLSEHPTLVATLDGLKVEALAAHEARQGIELVVGTDDEDFGGVLRRLPPAEPGPAGRSATQ